MTESRLATIARRGLSLPIETREQIRTTGIRCRPQLEIVYQDGAKQWKLRGEESGGAVEPIGHYVGFVDAVGVAIPWLQRIQNFIPNGVHAVVVTGELVRVEMFRYEKTYDLLITRHWLEGDGNKRPELRSTILFLSRNGSLETELWGKDSAFRGGAMPRFYKRNGEPGGPESMWVDSVMKATEGACCPGCRHSPARSGSGQGCPRGGASMIRWHHPRIYQRLRCFGLSLFTLGLAAHNLDNPPAAIAAITVTVLILIRLKIELDIRHDEDEPGFEQKLHRIEQINSLVIVPAVFGLIAMVRRLEIG